MAGPPQQLDPLPSMLMKLSDDAQDVFFNNLSNWSLMDLRLVSKSMKKVVETCCLDRLYLHVMTFGQMEENEFKESSTMWRSIVIKNDSQNYNFNWIQHDLYSQLFNKFSTSLRTLKLAEHHLSYSGIRWILSTCEALKFLEIKTFWCGEWFEEDPNGADYTKVMASFGRLETLLIGYLEWEKEEDVQVFKYILSNCSNVTFLRVPHILMSSYVPNENTDEVEDYLSLFNTCLLDPLLEYISSRKEQKNKDGVIMAKYLDVENMHHTEIFPRVLHACFKTGMTLHNVSEAYEDAIPEDDVNCLEIIESLLGCTQYLNFHKLPNLKVLALDSENSASSDVNVDSITAPLTNLKSISFCLPGDISPNILNFLKQSRPSVKSLTIEFQVEEPILSHLFPISIVSQNYCQLRTLTFIDWCGVDDHLTLILNSLTSLVSLRLYRCPRITDRAFFGHDAYQPVLLKLKMLKDLWLDCLITSGVLKHVIRHMPIQSLYYSSDRVTLEGFMSLEQGPLTWSLISFPVIPPRDANAPDVKHKFLSAFKNLKQRPLFRPSVLQQVNVDVHHSADLSD